MRSSAQPQGWTLKEEITWIGCKKESERRLRGRLFAGGSSSRHRDSVLPQSRPSPDCGPRARQSNAQQIVNALSAGICGENAPRDTNEPNQIKKQRAPSNILP